MKNYNKIKKRIKFWKFLNIKGKSPLRYLNPFSSKRFNLENLYNTIYLFNKLLKTDFKPIPYSKSLSAIEKETNKNMVVSIIYELRLLFGSWFLLIISYITYTILEGLSFNLFSMGILFILLFVFGLMFNIALKLMRQKKLSTCSKDLIDQYCPIKDPKQYITREEQND